MFGILSIGVCDVVGFSHKELGANAEIGSKLALDLITEAQVKRLMREWVLTG